MCGGDLFLLNRIEELLPF